MQKALWLYVCCRKAGFIFPTTKESNGISLQKLVVNEMVPPTNSHVPKIINRPTHHNLLIVLRLADSIISGAHVVRNRGHG